MNIQQFTSSIAYGWAARDLYGLPFGVLPQALSEHNQNIANQLRELKEPDEISDVVDESNIPSIEADKASDAAEQSYVTRVTRLLSHVFGFADESQLSASKRAILASARAVGFATLGSAIEQASTPEPLENPILHGMEQALSGSNQGTILVNSASYLFRLGQRTWSWIKDIQGLAGRIDKEFTIRKYVKRQDLLQTYFHSVGDQLLRGVVAGYAETIKASSKNRERRLLSEAGRHFLTTLNPTFIDDIESGDPEVRTKLLGLDGASPQILEEVIAFVEQFASDRKAHSRWLKLTHLTLTKIDSRILLNIAKGAANTEAEISNELQKLDVDDEEARSTLLQITEFLKKKPLIDLLQKRADLNDKWDSYQQKILELLPSEGEKSFAKHILNTVGGTLSLTGSTLATLYWCSQLLAIPEASEQLKVKRWFTLPSEPAQATSLQSLVRLIANGMQWLADHVPHLYLGYESANRAKLLYDGLSTTLDDNASDTERQQASQFLQAALSNLDHLALTAGIWDVLPQAATIATGQATRSALAYVGLGNNVASWSNKQLGRALFATPALARGAWNLTWYGYHSLQERIAVEEQDRTYHARSKIAHWQAFFGLTMAGINNLALWGTRAQISSIGKGLVNVADAALYGTIATLSARTKGVPDLHRLMTGDGNPQLRPAVAHFLPESIEPDRSEVLKEYDKRQKEIGNAYYCSLTGRFLPNVQIEETIEGAHDLRARLQEPFHLSNWTTSDEHQTAAAAFHGLGALGDECISTINAKRPLVDRLESVLASLKSPHKQLSEKIAEHAELISKLSKCNFNDQGPPSTPHQIKKQYHKLSRIFHPDKNTHEKDAAAKVQEILKTNFEECT